MSTPVNTNMINGFKAVRTLSGAPVNFQEAKFATAAGDGTAIFPGDPVIFANGSDPNGFLTVTKATAGQVPIAGIMTGIVADGSQLQNAYRPASTAMYIYCIIDPNTIFEAQANAAVALNSAGFTCSMVQTQAGNTLTSTSGVQIDQSTLATNTATFAFKAMGFSQAVGNIPNATNNKLYVKINNSAYAPNGVVGV